MPGKLGSVGLGKLCLLRKLGISCQWDCTLLCSRSYCCAKLMAGRVRRGKRGVNCRHSSNFLLPLWTMGWHEGAGG